MYPANMNNHYKYHLARQRDLEAAAQEYRISTMVGKKKKNNVVRKYIGALLIKLGQKLAQQPGQDAQLAYSTQQ